MKRQQYQSGARKFGALYRRLRTYCLVAVCLVLSCGARAHTPDVLRVAAAADLTRAFGEIARVYEQKTGQKISLIFGSSGQLTQQIENGAPFDVFAAANEQYVDQLDKKGLLLPGTRQLYARGKLVLWTRKGGPALPATLADLVSARYAHIAIANPDHAPYGLAAKQALQASGIWDALQPKLVTGENIQQTYQFAATGNADIALVSRALVSEGTGLFRPVPDKLYAPLLQAIAGLKGSLQAEPARQFVRFVTEGTGRTILKKYGFEMPGKALIGKAPTGKVSSTKEASGTKAQGH